MKNSLKIILSAAVLLPLGISCDKAVREEAAPDGLITIRASFPGDDTRGAGVVTTGVSWAWAADDVLTVTGESSEVFQIKEGFTPKQAEFTGKAVKGSSFSIAYPSMEDGDWTVQTQTGNDDLSHLRYRAVLEGVNNYTNFSFSPEWASAHGGTLRQTGVLKLNLTLPAEITTVTTIRISAESQLFYAGNGETMTDKLNLNFADGGVTFAPGASLVGWMTTSWNEALLPSGTVLTVTVQSPEKALSRDILIVNDVTIRSGVINTLTLDSSEWSEEGESIRYSGGKGTQAKPWIITTAEQMTFIREDLVSGAVRYFKLGADIDMSGITSWIPINYESPYDKAIDFDGDGHTISNFSCSAPTYPGIFGVLYGNCRNLNITGATIETQGATAAGILAGYVGTTNIPAEVHNVHVSGTVTNSFKKRGIGGLAGILGNGTITDSSAEATVTNTGGDSGVGGFVGLLNGTVERCWANSTVNSNGAYAGGLFGFDGSKSTVRNCWTMGNVTASQKAGGIGGGLIRAESAIYNCFSLADVRASFVVAGIAGHCNLDAKNGNTTNDPKNVIEKCIAWNVNIEATVTDASAHYSSGVIVGYTALMNYLTDCYRKADIVFTECPAALEYNIPHDQENSTPSNPLVETWNGTYNFPYHGKAAPANATLSSVASSLGWDVNVWDLSEDIPKLKKP